MKELVTWLTNHPHLAQALEQWRDNTSGAENDRHVQVKSGPASARQLGVGGVLLEGRSRRPPRR